MPLSNDPRAATQAASTTKNEGNLDKEPKAEEETKAPVDSVGVTAENVGALEEETAFFDEAEDAPDFYAQLAANMDNLSTSDQNEAKAAILAHDELMAKIIEAIEQEATAKSKERIALENAAMSFQDEAKARQELANILSEKTKILRQQMANHLFVVNRKFSKKLN